MTLFEDPLEIHYNAENRLKDVRHVETLWTALRRVAAPPEDLVVILDWESLHYISDPLDVEIETDLPAEHLELGPDKIGRKLDTRATIHGVDAGQAFGLVMRPYYVRYDNTIADQEKVLAIDFTDA